VDSTNNQNQFDASHLKDETFVNNGPEWKRLYLDRACSALLVLLIPFIIYPALITATAENGPQWKDLDGASSALFLWLIFFILSKSLSLGSDITPP